MTVTALTLAAQEKGKELPGDLEPWMYGVIAFVIFTVLLLITWTFNKDR
jgi:hypothetical protein